MLREDMRIIPFVDAHVHHWDLSGIRYPWLTPPFSDGPNGSVAAIAEDYLPADYRAEAAGWTVAGYVHVDAGADPREALDETQWLSRLDAGPNAIVAFAALDDPNIDALLAAHASYPRVRGIRHIVNWHSDPRRTYTPRDVTGDDSWARGFGALAKNGLSFDLQCYPAQMPGLVALLRRHDDVAIILNHLGMPIPSDPDGREVWRHGLMALADLPQVSIKVSGFGFAKRPWTVDDARPYVLEAIDLFGTDRCLVASDFPTDRLFGGFDQTLGAYAAIIAPFSEPERRAMWGGNANRIYRLGLQLQDTLHG